MSEAVAYLVDAFTETPGKGNRAGVVLDAAALDAAQMQEIARVIGASETAFVIRSEVPQPDYDFEVKYFTPKKEVPSCGHATIATNWLLAFLKNTSSDELRIKTQAGILPINIDRIGDRIQITMTQRQPKLEAPLGVEDRRAILEALHITENDLISDMPIQVADTGHSKVMVPLKSKAILDGLKLNGTDLEKLVKVSERIGCNGFFAFTLDTGGREDIFLAGRMFAPAIGIPEDPVTGNANGPAIFYLHEHGLLKDFGGQNPISYKAIQGEAMGKSGIITAALHCENGNASKVQVIGSAVLAGEMVFNIAVRPPKLVKTEFISLVA